MRVKDESGGVPCAHVAGAWAKLLLSRLSTIAICELTMCELTMCELTMCELTMCELTIVWRLIGMIAYGG